MKQSLIHIRMKKSLICIGWKKIEYRMKQNLDLGWKIFFVSYGVLWHDTFGQSNIYVSYFSNQLYYLFLFIFLKKDDDSYFFFFQKKSFVQSWSQKSNSAKYFKALLIILVSKVANFWQINFFLDNSAADYYLGMSWCALF